VLRCSSLFAGFENHDLYLQVPLLPLELDSNDFGLASAPKSELLQEDHSDIMLGLLPLGLQPTSVDPNQHSWHYDEISF